MDIKQINYFETAYKVKSFSQAAQILLVSQQNVSKTIKNLEDELGTQLFMRKASGIVPTLEGEYFHEEAQKILKIYSEIVDHFLKIKTSAQKNLIIGLSHGLSYFFNDSFFKRLKKEVPAVSIKIIDLFNSEITQKLEEGEIDIGITVAPKKERFYQIVHLFNEPIYCVVNKKHPFAQHEKLSFEEILDEKLIMVNENYSSYHKFIQKCENIGKIPRYIETTDLFDIYERVMRSQVVGFTLESLKDYIRFDQIIHIPLEDEDAFWDVSLIYKKQNANRMIEKFCNFCKDQVGSREKNQ